MDVSVCHRCFLRDWSVIDYGMCDLMDLLTEIPDTTITITQQDDDMVISVPKRGENPLNTHTHTETFGSFTR